MLPLRAGSVLALLASRAPFVAVNPLYVDQACHNGDATHYRQQQVEHRHSAGHPCVFLFGLVLFHFFLFSFYRSISYGGPLVMPTPLSLSSSAICEIFTLF